MPPPFTNSLLSDACSVIAEDRVDFHYAVSLMCSVMMVREHYTLEARRSGLLT